MGLLCIGLILVGCTGRLPAPVTVADPKSAKKPDITASLPAITMELRNQHPKATNDGWEFRFLDVVNGTYDAISYGGLGTEEKRYAGWFMCGTYRNKYSADDIGLFRPFIAYFDPASGRFLYLIPEEMQTTATGCNQLYGKVVMETRHQPRFRKGD